MLYRLSTEIASHTFLQVVEIRPSVSGEVVVFVDAFVVGVFGVDSHQRGVGHVRECGGEDVAVGIEDLALAGVGQVATGLVFGADAVGGDGEDAVFDAAAVHGALAVGQDEV